MVVLVKPDDLCYSYLDFCVDHLVGWKVVFVLSYFVVEYDGLAPAGLDNTTINILLTKG